MKANEFDKAIRHSYDQGSFDYDPAKWENMAQQLNDAESKRKSLAWLPFISYAASILFMVSIGAFLMRTNAPQEKVAANNSSSERDMKVAQTHVKQEVAWQNNAGNKAVSEPIQNAGTKKAIAPVHEPLLQAQSPVLAVVMPQDDENIMDASFAFVQTVSQPVLRKAPRYVDFNNYAYEPERTEETTRTIISVTGGLNYGGANSGYAMGFTAHQKLGENIFFEGDVAFVNNLSGKKTEFITEGYTPTTTTTTTTTSSLGGSTSGSAAGTAARGAHNTAARPSGTTPTYEETTVTTTTTDPVKGNHYNLYYAQVTPTIGYNVFKNLALSGGADVQRLLQSDKLMTVTQNVEDAKHLPSYDLGFVGKTEYAISKEVKATVYYRHGLNNAVSGSDKYIDRNYIQFQLKFSILNR